MDGSGNRGERSVMSGLKEEEEERGERKGKENKPTRAIGRARERGKSE